MVDSVRFHLYSFWHLDLCGSANFSGALTLFFVLAALKRIAVKHYPGIQSRKFDSYIQMFWFRITGLLDILLDIFLVLNC